MTFPRLLTKSGTKDSNTKYKASTLNSQHTSIFHTHLLKLHNRLHPHLPSHRSTIHPHQSSVTSHKERASPLHNSIFIFTPATSPLSHQQPTQIALHTTTTSIKLSPTLSIQITVGTKKTSKNSKSSHKQKQ